MERYTVFVAGIRLEVCGPLLPSLEENADAIVRQKDRHIVKDRFSEFPDKRVDLSKV